MRYDNSAFGNRSYTSKARLTWRDHCLQGDGDEGAEEGGEEGNFGAAGDEDDDDDDDVRVQLSKYL